MALDLVQRYNTRDLAVQVDSGARTVLPGTNVSFTTDPVTGAITINASGGGGVGTVTSVGLAAPTGFTVSGSPVTTTGTLTFSYDAGYVGYTTTEQTKLAGIAAGATVGATWGVNLASIPANITAWAAIAPVAKQDALVSSTSNTISGNQVQRAALTGNVTAPANSNTTTIANDAVTNARLADMATATMKGRVTAGTGDPEDLTTTQARTLLAINNVDNTSDVNKPVSTAQATADNLRVLKTGDTMTGTLTLAAAYGLRFSGSAGGRLLVLDDSGVPSLQWMNAGETLFSVGRYVATEHRFIGGTLDSFAGTRIFNAGQLRIYDNNNDTPLEIGMGYTTTSDRNAYIWNRNNGFISIGTNNTERVRVQPGGAVDVSGQLAVINNNLVVSGGDIYTYRSGGTTGGIFLNSSATRYLFYDGTNYDMPTANRNLGGGVTLGTGKKLTKVTLSTAAPAGLSDGELYLRY